MQPPQQQGGLSTTLYSPYGLNQTGQVIYPYGQPAQVQHTISGFAMQQPPQQQIPYAQDNSIRITSTIGANPMYYPQQICVPQTQGPQSYVQEQNIQVPPLQQNIPPSVQKNPFSQPPWQTNQTVRVGVRPPQSSQPISINNQRTQVQRSPEGPAHFAQRGQLQKPRSPEGGTVSPHHQHNFSTTKRGKSRSKSPRTTTYDGDFGLSTSPSNHSNKSPFVGGMTTKRGGGPPSLVPRGGSDMKQNSPQQWSRQGSGSNGGWSTSPMGDDVLDDDDVQDYEEEFLLIVAGYFSILEREPYSSFLEKITEMNIDEVRKTYTPKRYESMTNSANMEMFFLLSQGVNIPDWISTVNKGFNMRIGKTRDAAIERVIHTNIKTAITLSAGTILNDVTSHGIFGQAFIFGERLIDVVEDEARGNVSPEIFCGYETEAEGLFEKEMRRLRDCVYSENQYTLFVCQMTPLTDLDFDACTARIFITTSAKTDTMKRVTIGCHKEDSNRLDRWLKTNGYYRKMKSHIRVESSMLEKMIFLGLKSESGKIDILRSAANVHIKHIPLWSCKLDDTTGVLACIPKDPKKARKLPVLRRDLFFKRIIGKQRAGKSYPFDVIWGISSSEKLVISKLAFESSPCRNINSPMSHFARNVVNWHNSTIEYLGIPKVSINTPSREFLKIKAWFRNLRPVHQCSAGTALTISKFGWACSLNTLASLWKSPEKIAHIIWEVPEAKEMLRKLMDKNEDIPRIGTLRRYVLLYCKTIRAERSPKIVIIITI